jgi:hypothetical protein
VKIRRVGAAWIGAVTLAGAAVAAHAEGTTTQPFKMTEGVVAAVDFSANKLDIHPAAGSDVIVSVGPTTRWNRGTAVFPSSPQPKPHTQAETAPNPDAYIGLYVRAQYNPSTMLAAYIWLNAPTALHAEGVIHSASATGLAVDLTGGGALQFAMDGNTVCRLDGQPVSGGGLAPGDPVAVTFFLKPAENLAAVVMARTAPPRTLIGLFLVPAVQDPATNAFSVKGSSQTLNFTVDDKTQFFINDKPAAFADLKANQPVFVQYLADGSVFLARRVAQSQKVTPVTTIGPGTDPKKVTTHEPNPELVAALKALNEAKMHLQNAARDFGGLGAVAAGLTDQAISEVLAAIAFDAAN